MIARIIKLALIVALFMAAAGVSTYLTVHLLIRSKETVVVPELVGKGVVYALELLTDLGLNTKVKGSEFSAKVPKHHIISQDPAAGMEIKQGRDVRLIISKGARSVVLPNLSGVGVPQARILLEENGLALGHLSYAYNQARPNEEIISQYPLPGTMGMRGDRVDLLVSAGKAFNLQPMMDLKGIGLNQAIAIIEQHHLIAGAIRSVRDKNLADDTVVDHRPPSGYPVAPGRTIDLTINRTGSSTAKVRRQGIHLFRHRMAHGFLRQHVRVRINTPSFAIDIFNAFVRAGEEVWLLVPKDDPATLMLYIDDELAMTKHFD